MAIYVVEVSKRNIAVERMLAITRFNRFTQDMFYRNQFLNKSIRGCFELVLFCAIIGSIISLHDRIVNGRASFFTSLSPFVLIASLIAFFKLANQPSNVIGAYKISSIAPTNIIGAFNEDLSQEMSAYSNNARSPRKKNAFSTAGFLMNMHSTGMLKSLNAETTQLSDGNSLQYNQNWQPSADSILIFVKDARDSSSVFRNGIQEEVVGYSTLAAANEDSQLIRNTELNTVMNNRSTLSYNN